MSKAQRELISSRFRSGKNIRVQNQSRHENFMREAFKLAEKGLGRTAPNPPVGAVIVKNNKIIGRGWHQGAGLPHAEIKAIKDAGIEAKGASIYVTLEPCNHFGKTPPCSKAIKNAGLINVYFSVRDPHQKAGGGGAFLRNAGLKVEGNILLEEGEEMIKGFLARIRKNRPHVLLKLALTLDGKIADHTGESRYISSSGSRKLVHEWRNFADGVMVGGNTFASDNPRLNCRLPQGKDPLRFILDAKLKHFNLHANVFKNGEGQIYFVVSDKLEISEKEILPAKLIKSPVRPDGYFDLHFVFNKLAELGLNRVMVEGGGKLAASLIEEQIVDEIALFYAPVFMLDNAAVNGFGSKKSYLVKDMKRLSSYTCSRIGDDLLLQGKF
ncbi:MAG: bifunctional diaminohydroxyphosphoribosylaminopyrimidine deaminase/5-amino-6-(5-phosphoribosylamino)uracil reductase RibD [Deltaproteobacteria bacterium]|jgi:diaminohydroxyphosphoribosylaminopyrimidine deaminase/5-amino-6-(5-phosphoribosylamino)uracil reductase|nr:bifunctional diaminohydroxyphosphoribosylaminopyrimidine deaminase/5-amino-6-(5-phosphoribosylamino)uracil reductase RibD [Deltaproteobacteria bacterium]